MKIAIVGSRSLKNINVKSYINEPCLEIVSGGAAGVDSSAEKYAKENGIKFTVFLPDYNHYGRAAPIIRNKKIVEYADKIIIIWDGISKGTLSVINYAKKLGKPYRVFIPL